MLMLQYGLVCNISLSVGGCQVQLSTMQKSRFVDTDYVSIMK